MGQIVRGGLPLVGIGAEVNRWSRGTLNTTFATGIVQAHVPLTDLLLKVGVGYGRGDPDGLGRINGAAVQLGDGDDLTVPFAPIAATFLRQRAGLPRVVAQHATGGGRSGADLSLERLCVPMTVSQ